MDKIANYICIGDSVSIDCYPYFELSQNNPQVSDAVGAASLLYKNDDEVWPEFTGHDLVSKYPDLQFCKLAEDGATTFDFLDEAYLQLLHGRQEPPALVTVTLCGNDLLRILTQDKANLEEETKNVIDRYNKVVDLLTKAVPRGICILSSVYDPTDGTGQLPGFGDISEQLIWLQFINYGIEKCARRKLAIFADVYKHFFGHGLSAPKGERWYWEPSPIEPGARGASELRRLWYDLLSAEGLV